MIMCHAKICPRGHKLKAVTVFRAQGVPHVHDQDSDRRTVV